MIDSQKGGFLMLSLRIMTSSYVPKLKGYVQKHIPFLYPAIYKTYFRVLRPRVPREYVEKYANFAQPGFYPFELDSVKFDIKLDPANRGVDSEIFADKSYEPEILRHLGANLKHDDVFIDIGANIGQHTLYASYFCKHVYAFEPINRLYMQCVESIFKNNILNVSMYNYGLGNKTEELPIYSNGSSMASSSVYATKNKTFIQHIRIRRFDDIYQAVGIERADMMKIDVEGFEWEVLQGAQKFIQRFKPKILMEFSPYFYTRKDKNISNEIFDFLIDAGYEVYDLIEHTDQKVKIRSLADFGNKTQTTILCLQK